MPKKRILLVDDEVIITQILTVILEDEFNAIVKSAHSGREAIDLLREDSAFDLIISDFGMPHGTGEDLFKYIKGELKLPIPFILFSGGTIEEYDFFKNEVKDENQCYFVEKPSDIEIINVVKSSLERQASSDREQIIASSADNSYLPMPIEVLIKYLHKPCDVFLKINDSKYLKVSSKLNDSFIEDIERQKDKDVKELFLEKHDFLNFFHSLQVKLQGDDNQASSGKRILFEIAGLTINVDQ
ncbi:MAG: response regulator [Oligoflexia bacterium]|nr:response regulator [Oligoflexia bacterium]